MQYISYIRELPTSEKRNAELALLFRQPQQAEAIYLQAGLIFRAIQLNMNLFNWERWDWSTVPGLPMASKILLVGDLKSLFSRALELAVKHKTHVDTVLGYRERYLGKIGSKESLKQYKHFSGKVRASRLEGASPAL